MRDIPHRGAEIARAAIIVDPASSTRDLADQRWGGGALSGGRSTRCGGWTTLAPATTSTIVATIDTTCAGSSKPGIAAADNPAKGHGIPPTGDFAASSWPEPPSPSAIAAWCPAATTSIDVVPGHGMIADRPDAVSIIHPAGTINFVNNVKHSKTAKQRPAIR